MRPITNKLILDSRFDWFLYVYTVHNNCHTRHLAMFLIHLIWSLQEAIIATPKAWVISSKDINAIRFSFVFLKYLIENFKGDNFEEPLFLNPIDNDVKGDDFPQGKIFFQI